MNAGVRISAHPIVKPMFITHTHQNKAIFPWSDAHGGKGI